MIDDDSFYGSFHKKTENAYGSQDYNTALTQSLH